MGKIRFSWLHLTALASVCGMLPLTSFAQSKRCDGLDRDAQNYSHTWDTTFDKWMGGQPQAQQQQFAAWANPIIGGWGPGALSSGCPNVASYKRLIDGLSAARSEFALAQVSAGQPDHPTPVTGGGQVLPMPCAKPGDGNTWLRSCEKVTPALTKLLNDRVDQLGRAHYQGCDPATATDAQVADGSCRPQGVAAPKVCDRFGDPLGGGQPEIGDANHLGTSCGNWVYMSVHLSGRTCSVKPVTGGPQGFGDREDGYVRGLLIHSLDCYRHVVDKEVATQKLNLSVVNTELGVIKGPCATMAQDYISAVTSANASQSALATSLGTKLNIGDIENCPAEGVPFTGGAASVLIGQNRQSACQLIASRAMLEASFAQLAACEVLYRADQAYDRFRISSAGESFNTMAFKKFNSEKCHSKSASDCSPERVQVGCYEKKYLDFFSSRAQEVWPTALCTQ